jgi:hypothetical protein
MVATGLPAQGSVQNFLGQGRQSCFHCMVRHYLPGSMVMKPRLICDYPAKKLSGSYLWIARSTWHLWTHICFCGCIKSCVRRLFHLQILTDFCMNCCTTHALLYYVPVLMTFLVTHCIAGPSGCAVWGIGLDHLDAEAVGLNPIQGRDVRPHLVVIIIHLPPCHWRYTVYLLRKCHKINYQKGTL